MKNKNTDWLEHELSDARSVESFLSENKTELKNQTLSEHLEWLLTEKGLNKAEVIEKSGLDKVYAYHIFAGRKKSSRNRILSLALAMELSPDETQHLLYYAGVEQLYVRNSWDSVIWYALENKMSVVEVNLLLDKLGEDKLLQ
ncbi:hypothetical protein D081_1130 [Anaerovibrio sp. JC8]|uniref:helix-turn-helix domain-containing protein n=1 Tax=Anaerovibrio sp. JC8 TaxID=1240085 RepID=UPI000A0AA993|nr:helix-turn-helix domain-containing protein [Anaerovibrio sp. JC8]ORU00036.1 hypothetical protein D081_1130 [Anaerovibrio sp. JC8]